MYCSNCCSAKSAKVGETDDEYETVVLSKEGCMGKEREGGVASVDLKHRRFVITFY
jgi:hypothetical protein